MSNNNQQYASSRATTISYNSHELLSPVNYPRELSVIPGERLNDSQNQIKFRVKVPNRNLQLNARQDSTPPILTQNQTLDQQNQAKIFETSRSVGTYTSFQADQEISLLNSQIQSLQEELRSQSIAFGLLREETQQVQFQNSKLAENQVQLSQQLENYDKQLLFERQHSAELSQQCQQYQNNIEKLDFDQQNMSAKISVFQLQNTKYTETIIQQKQLINQFAMKIQEKEQIISQLNSDIVNWEQSQYQARVQFQQDLVQSIEQANLITKKYEKLKIESEEQKLQIQQLQKKLAQYIVKKHE